MKRRSNLDILAKSHKSDDFVYTCAAAVPRVNNGAENKSNVPFSYETGSSISFIYFFIFADKITKC